MIQQLKKIISSQLVTPTIINPMSDDLTGMVIVVTGASRGIGRAIVTMLKNENAIVIGISRKIEEVKNTHKSEGENVLLLSGDVTAEKDVTYLSETIVKKYKKVDVLINNVGAFLDKPLENTTSEQFDSIIASNVKGMFLMTKAFMPLMKKQKNGYIINIGSKISHNTNVGPNKVLYAMTKYAVEGFSFALNKELKPYHVRVSALMPGTINNFLSLKSKQFLSPSQVGMLIASLIKMKDIDFESIVFKSVHQDL